MAESSSNSENNIFTIRSSLSNEHLVFAETLRDWRDPLLHGYEPAPTLLCPRCVTCKCQSLKGLRNHNHHDQHNHDPSCPNYNHQYDRTKSSNKQRSLVKSKRRAISHDPSIKVLNTSSSSIIKSKSNEYSPLTNSIKQENSLSDIPVKISPSSSSAILSPSSTTETKIPQLILSQSLSSSTITTDDLFDIDSLNEDVYRTPTTMSDNDNEFSKTKPNKQLDTMDEDHLTKKKKKKKKKSKRSKSASNKQDEQGRNSKSKTRSNDLCSSNSSSTSSLSIVPLRKKPCLEDFSFKQLRQSRSRSTFISTESNQLIQLQRKTHRTNLSNLSKTIPDVWKSTNSYVNDDEDSYPRYFIEYVQPITEFDQRSLPILSKNIVLQRGQIDYWQNCEIFNDSIITSSCQNSTGSASYLLSKSAIDSNGNIISITTTKRSQPSLLHKSKNTLWNIESDGKQLRYSKGKWHSDEQLHKQNKYLTDSNTDTGSGDEQNNQIVPVIIHNTNESNQNQQVSENLLMETNSKSNESIAPRTVIDKQLKDNSYASTDEDVDELNSHYSDLIQQNSPEKLNTYPLFSNHNQNEISSNLNSTSRPRILSTEHSQITMDSGVDITHEQKIYQPNTTSTIDEQSYEETIDQNDLFAVSDDSITESPRHNKLLTTFNPIEQETKNELIQQNDPYSGYELETITDEDEDQHYSMKEEDSNELVLISDSSKSSATTPPPPTPPTSSIPSKFQFKLPSFAEWIDRAFTTFLSETNPEQPRSASSSRSSSIVSVHGSQDTINTLSSSQPVTVLENPNVQSSQIDEDNNNNQNKNDDDEEHSLNDMSSSSLNYDEKVDFDTYMINSNYEKINPSITNEQTEILFHNERSKSFISSITSSIENDDQDLSNNQKMANDEMFKKPIEYHYSSNSNDSLIQSDEHHHHHRTIDTITTTSSSSIEDLTRLNQFLSSSTFHSKDSAVGLSDENLNQHQQQILLLNKIDDNNEITINPDITMDDHTISKPSLINEHDQSIEQTISSTSSEQLIPKEKQTGMYYKAFGSSATIHLAEQYHFKWTPDNSLPTIVDKPPPPSSIENDDNHLRIVRQCQILGDNEDEFYFSPQVFHPSYSCPNLYSNPNDSLKHFRSYSLTALDSYKHLNITYETLEQIWLSLLDLAFSDKDDYELGEYKLRHIIGLSNSYSNINQTFIEKSRSHNDLFSLNQKTNPKPINKTKSKSLDITSLIRKPSSSSNTNDSANLGLLQGADISEPFADRVISTSNHSEIESLQSIEPEPIPIETPIPSSSSPPPTIKEPLDYVFNFSSQINTDEFDFDIETKPINISITYDTDDIPPPPIRPIHDTYTELSLFRPHSLSTIPSSRASQYASSVDSDDFFERDRNIQKENSEDNYPFHISDDDHGVIDSEFSSPQSRPLSSLQSHSFSPEQNLNEIESVSNNNIEYLNNLTTIIPIETMIDQNPKDNYLIDEIEPILLLNTTNNAQENFIEKIDDNISSSSSSTTSIEQDYLTIEQPIANQLNPIELTNRLEQLDIPPKIPTKSYQTQRIDKVSDLEIVKQGNGFKIGYIDRQGTDQRIILTKRLPITPDIHERDPHIRLPYKGRKILNKISSSVLYTNGYNTFEEDKKFANISDDIEIPIIGTNPKHFDESDMVSIDIDGPSTMLNSICESLVITQGSVYTKPVQTAESIKKDKIKVIDSWHDRTIINGNSTPWRSPFKPPKKATRDIALSPIAFICETSSQTLNGSPLTIDRSCQYSPPIHHDQGLQCYFESLASYDMPGYLKESPLRTIRTLERSADSGILVDDQNHRTKSNLALQVDIKSSSSDSEDISEITKRPLTLYDTTNLNMSTIEIEQEIDQLRRERAHILDLLSLNWNRSNIWVELTEAKLNYIIGETDALLQSLSFDTSPIDNETIKLRMHQYEEDMAELTRQHLAVYRERLEDSKKQLDIKINELELKKSSLESQAKPNLIPIEQIPRLIHTKRSKLFLSTSAENLTSKLNDDTITTHPQLLDISFLTTKNSDQQLNHTTNNQNETIHRPVPRYPTKNLSNMEGLSQSQQAIIDETDELVKDSQQLHTESASQFERARESLLSSETSIRLAQATLAASRYSERKTYLPNDITLAELFKYEQSLAKEAAKSHRHIYSTTES